MEINSNMSFDDNFGIIAEKQLLQPMRRMFDIKVENGKYQVSVNADQVVLIPKLITSFLEIVAEHLIVHFDAKDPDFKLKLALNKLKQVFSNLPKKFDESQITNIMDLAQDSALILESSFNEKLSIMPSFKAESESSKVIANLIREHGSLIKAYHLLLSNADSISKVSDHWIKSPILKERWPILKKALDCHAREEFELSIPIFLIHIESLFSDLFKGKVARLDSKRKKDIIKTKIAEKLIVNGFEYDVFLKDDVLNTVMDEILRHEDSPMCSIFPNRHAIIHGRDLDYYKNTLSSTRCIITLDGMTNIKFDEYIFDKT